jgi:hypothetical protein
MLGYSMSKNEFLRKSVFGEARVRNLLSGIISIVVAVILMAYLFGALLGIGREGNTIVISNFAQWTQALALIIGLTFTLCIFGGLEIGRYTEAEFGKKRKSLELPPPP